MTGIIIRELFRAFFFHFYPCFAKFGVNQVRFKYVCMIDGMKRQGNISSPCQRIIFQKFCHMSKKQGSHIQKFLTCQLFHNSFFSNKQQTMFKQVALVLTLVVLFAYAQHYDYNAVEAEDAMFYDNDNTNTMFWRRFKRAFSRVGRGFRSVGRGFRSMGHHMGRGFKKFGNTMKDWHDKSRMNQWISYVAANC